MIETIRATDPRNEKMREYEQDCIERQNAMLWYVAMMADVDLPENDDTEADDE